MQPTDPTATQAPTPNANRPVLAWFERQSPAIRAAVVVLVTTAINQTAPWLRPLLSALSGTPVEQ